MPYIEVIPYRDAEGRLKEIYDDLMKKRGKLAAVHTIQSLNPESIVNHMDLYLTLMFGASPLRRYQREMMAVVVSVTNQCPYCVQHHAEALLHYWKDPGKVEQLKSDYRQTGLDRPDLALCEWAEFLTANPASDPESMTGRLKAAGFNDRAILDATLIISYFNFVNRIVLGLGVEIEQEGAGGYKY